MILEIFLGAALIFSLILLAIIFTEMTAFVRTRVPFVPTPREHIPKIIEFGEIDEKDIFYDLGSGNGRVVIKVAKKTKAKSFGFQLNGWTQWYAKIKSSLIGARNAKFLSTDFFKHSWSEASVIYAYLYPFLMNQVGEKFLHDCKPGTILVIRDFPIKNLTADKYHKFDHKHELFAYIKK